MSSGVDLVRLGMEVQQDAVPQDRRGQRRDVFVGHVIAAVHQRARLGGQHQVLNAADAGAEVDVLLDEVRRGRVGRARHANEVDRIAGDRIGDRHHADELLEAEDLLGRRDRLGLRNRWSWWSSPMTFISSSGDR